MEIIITIAFLDMIRADSIFIGDWYNNKSLATEGVVTSDSLTYGEEISSNMVTKTLEMFERLMDPGRTLNELRHSDDFDNIKDDIEKLEIECLTGKCDPTDAQRNFCNRCGICKAILSVREVLSYLAMRTPRDFMRPIKEGCNDDKGCDYEPHKETIIRRAVEACPSLCQEEKMRFIEPEPLGPNSNSDNSTDRHEYVIHIPRSYNCKRNREIETICFDVHHWLKNLDQLYLDEEIQNLLAPTIAVCFHDSADIFKENMFLDRESFLAMNEEV